MKKYKEHKIAKTVLLESSDIGDGTAIWHYSHIRKGAKIGKNCVIGKYVEIGKNVRIGDGCHIQNLAQVYEGVTLGKNVFVGPGVIFINDTYPVLNNKVCEMKKGKGYEETRVGDNVIIGAGAIIFPVNIEKNAFIGAGSIVTKSVPENVVACGVPAVITGIRGAVKK